MTIEFQTILFVISNLIVGFSLLGIVVIIVPSIESPTTTSRLALLKIFGAVFHSIGGLTYLFIVYYQLTAGYVNFVTPLSVAVLCIQAVAALVSLFLASHFKPIRFLHPEDYAELLERREKELLQKAEDIQRGKEETN